MTELVSAVQSDLTSLSTAVDGRFGYPKDGVDVGGGFHVTAAQSRTLRHGLVIKHPTLSLWRYTWDQKVQDEVPKGLVLPVSATPTALDSTWFP